MSSDATMDVARAAEYSEIENSILDAPIVGNWAEGSLAESGEEADPFQPVEPGGGELLADLETDRSYQQGEQAEQEQRGSQQTAPEAQQVPQTPEAIHESLERLDATIQESGLNDAESAREFCNGFCEAFGVNPVSAGVDAMALGHTMSKVAFSALQTYEACGGDPSKLQPIPPQAAEAFSRDFLKAWGMDPRTVQVDAQGLANTVLGGVLNFLHTYQSYGGRVTDMDRLNSADNAVQYLGSFLKAFGVDTVPDRGMALKFADAAGKYLLGFMGKVQQLQQPAPKASRSRRQASPKFRTNNDVFDPETMEAWEQEQAVGRRSSASQEFAAKPRAPRSRFQTNSDLFDEQTLSLLNTRL